MFRFVKTKLKQAKLAKKREADKLKDTPQYYPLQLSPSEVEYVRNTLMSAGGGGIYLEFGSGGSTFLALLHAQVRIVSVESDKNWIEYLKGWKVIDEATKVKRLEFIWVDIGRTGEWGVPLEMEKKSLFPHYSAQVFEKYTDFDVVFIDGRFRVACFLQTLLHCPKHTKILIHDFNNRPFYHKILEFVDFVDTCDTLAEFKIKDNIDKQRLLALYEEYKYIWE